MLTSSSNNPIITLVIINDKTRLDLLNLFCFDKSGLRIGARVRSHLQHSGSSIVRSFLLARSGLVRLYLGAGSQ
jgi:hypothetical protein